MTKGELRKQILKLRDDLPSYDREAEDASIRTAVKSVIREKSADTVLIYVSFRSEVDTYGIIEDCIKSGIRVAVPRVERSDIFFYYIDSQTDLVSGYMGILEPAEGCVPCSVEPYRSLIIAPGSVFDRYHNRIGYGGGYYDRFISRNHDIYSIGLAYSCQIVDSIPEDEWDQPLDMVITGEAIYQ